MHDSLGFILDKLTNERGTFHQQVHEEMVNHTNNYWKANYNEMHHFTSKFLKFDDKYQQEYRTVVRTAGGV